MPRYPISRLAGPMGVWLLTVAAACGAAWLLGSGVASVLSVGLLLAVPALLTLILLPAVRHDWAQGLVMLIWTGFAVLGALLGGLDVLLILFLCVPAIGMMFFRGRVLEGLALGAIALVATVLGAGYLGALPTPLSAQAQNLLPIVGVAATLALVIAGMIAATDKRGARIADDQGQAGPWRDGVSGGLFEFDADDRLVVSNRQGRDQFGLDALTGRPRLVDLADDATATALMVKTAGAARRESRSADARIALGPTVGDHAHVDARFTPLSDGGLLLHTVDRTDEEARLEAVRRSHTVASREAADKTLFFAGVSHELRTPLNAIIGFSDMMRSRLFGPLPGKYAEYAELIHDSGHYMLDLIGDVLDLSKVEAGRYTLTLDSFDLADVVRSSVKMIRPASDAGEIVVDVDLPDIDALLVTADRKAVRQILLNLLSNAVKFSPKGSRITVRAAQRDADVFLSVSDQGAGMSGSELARVGEPFAQGAAGLSAETRGSGLGLSLVRQLAELHGGRLEIDSQPGRGTTAQVVLPNAIED